MAQNHAKGYTNSLLKVIESKFIYHINIPLFELNKAPESWLLISDTVPSVMILIGMKTVNDC
jgi:hypothetical protein